MNTDTLFMILTDYNCNLSIISRVNKNWKELLYMPLDKFSFREIKRNNFIFTNSNNIKKNLILELDKEIFDASHCYNNIEYNKNWRDNFLDWELAWYSFRECAFFYDFVYKKNY